MSRRYLTLTLVALLGLFASGCSTTSTDTSGAPGADSPTTAADYSTGDYADASGGIEVPDVSGQDGADAVASVEDAGLTATLADANDDPSFDSSRDATGCDVIDQDPAAGDTAAEGDEVTITVDCSQVDWENQEGPVWEAFNDAYSSGFDDGCQALFDQSPNGSLYENDYEYTVTDCQNENPGDASEASDVPTDVPDDPDGAGADLGELDGCQALFENEGVVSLNYGEYSITEADCPIGTSAAAPVATPHRATRRRGHKTAGETCLGKRADGSPLALQVERGSVKCTGGIALVDEWLRRAPREGTGSGGAMTLYGWQCVGATAAQPRVGSCERTDGSAAFTIFNGK